MNPIRALEGWFEELPPGQQEEVATLVLFAVPDFPENEFLKESFKSVEAFRSWLSRGATLPVRVAGKALIVRAVVDTFVAHGRSSSQEAMLHAWVEEARAEGESELAEAFEQAVTFEPFRSRQWQRSLARWNEVRERELSDDALNAWAVGRRSS